MKKDIIKYYLSTVLAIVLLVANVAPVIASDITDAEWHGIIRATNNGTAASGVSVNLSLGSDSLVSSNYANSGLTDITIQYGGSDVATMPGYGSNPWAFWVESIGASQNENYDLYTGNVSGGVIRYFPGAIGMNSGDPASLEPSGNWTGEWTGQFDTTAVGANITSKGDIYPQGAIRVYNASSGNIAFSVGLWDDFTYNGWTQVGTKVTVNTTADRIDYKAEQSAVDNRVYLDQSLLSDTQWKLEFTWRNTTQSGGTVHIGLFDALANPNGYGTDYVSIRLGPTALARIDAVNGGAKTSSNTCAWINNLTYYPTLQRHTSTNVTLSLYTDSARTTHAVGSPVTLAVPAGIVNLRYIQVSNVDDNAGAANEQIGWLDDIELNYARVNATGVTSGEHTAEAGIIPNLITNGSAIVDTAGWIAVRSVVARDTTSNAYDGSSFNITTSTLTSAYMYQNLDGHSEFDGATVVLGARVKAPSTNTQDQTIMIRHDGGEFRSSVIPQDDAWHWITTNTTVTTTAIFRFHMFSNDSAVANTDVLYVDQIVFARASTLPIGGNFYIDVDGTEFTKWEPNSFSVPDTSANWTDCTAAAMPYVENVKKYVDGVLVQEIEWEYGATFTDSSGNSNDATPSFRTTSSDADVSAELISFNPVSEAKLITATSYGVPEILTTTPGTPSGLYDELEFTKIPGADAVNLLLEEGDIPQAQFWFPFIYITIVICMFLAYGASRRQGGTGTLWLPIIVGLAGLALAGQLGPVPYFPVFIFMITALGCLTAEKHKSLG